MESLQLQLAAMKKRACKLLMAMAEGCESPQDELNVNAIVLRLSAASDDAQKGKVERVRCCLHRHAKQTETQQSQKGH